MVNPNFMGDWSLPGGKDVVLTIQKFGEELGFDSKIGKKRAFPAIFFEEAIEWDWAKPFIPNSTNIGMLIKVTGKKFQEEMIGAKIQIGLIHGTWFGKEQDALRVRDVKSAKLLEDYNTFLTSIPNCKSRAELMSLMTKYAVYKPYIKAVQNQISALWATLQ